MLNSFEVKGRGFSGGGGASRSWSVNKQEGPVTVSCVWDMTETSLLFTVRSFGNAFSCLMFPSSCNVCPIKSTIYFYAEFLLYFFKIFTGVFILIIINTIKINCGVKI